MSTSTAPATQVTAEIDDRLPPVEGPEPSHEVVAFYYPWYRTDTREGAWDPWDHDGTYAPPEDIGADFYPELGPYSSTDPEVVAQHFAWLRRAGVGVIATSWWGQYDFTDRAVPLLLEMGERYGIRVAFHIEPYERRSADRLVEDIGYIYDKYGNSPAFFRTSESSPWSGEGNKGLFFLWVAEHANLSPPDLVAQDYWRQAMDEIHSFPDSAIVIANTLIGARVDLNHFDGLYNYATPHLDVDGGFKWAQGVPPNAWYVPSVLPGLSAKRIGYDPAVFIERLGGGTYDTQWEAALGVGVRPHLVAITSFNEWLEGTQIEPALPTDRGRPDPYLDYGNLPGDGYLDMTRGWIDRLQGYAWDEGIRARVRLTTTSSWSFVRTISGADWARPVLVSAAGPAEEAGFHFDLLKLSQSLGSAEAGTPIEVVFDLRLTNLDPSGEFVFDIGRGHIGSTDFEVFRYDGGEPVSVGRFTWSGITSDPENRETFRIPASDLLGLP